MNSFCGSRFPPGSLLAFSPLRLTQTYSWAPAIFIDELYAGGFQRAADSLVVRHGQRRFILSQLGPANSSDAQS
jgi:hypothetical protein